MRQQVNLYQPIFRKQEKKFSATVVLLQAPALILGVIAIFFAWTQWQVRQLNGELVRVDQQQAAAQKRLNDATQQFGGSAQVSQTVDEEIAKLQQRLAERQRMRELLGKGLFSNTNGFFEYLAAIGRQTPPGMGLWLTGFDIVGAGEQVTLQGRALNAEAVIVRVHAQDRRCRDAEGGPLVLRAQLRKLMERIDELSLRERAMVFLGVLGVLYVGAVQLVIQPLSAQRTRLETELKGKHDQIQTTERMIQAMLTGDAQDADAQKRAQRDALRAQLKAFDAELGKTTSGLVSPQEMARLLQQFLARKRSLQIVRVESLPAEPLAIATTGAVPNRAGPAVRDDSGLYKRGTRIEVRGNYDELLGYLKDMEALPWKVFWGQVTLQTEQYPISKLTLVIYTLSTQESWIGT